MALTYCKHVVPIRLDARNDPAHLVVLGRRGRSLRGGSHSVLVVLDHIHCRQVPQFRHVRRLRDLTLVAGAVAEHGHADVHLVRRGGFVARSQHVVVLLRKCKAGSNGYLGSNDGTTAEEVLLRLVHVHRPALSVSGARGMTKQFVDYRLHTRSADSFSEKLDSVTTVARDPIITGTNSLTDSGRTRFLQLIDIERIDLSVVEIQGSMDLSRHIQCITLRLHAPHHHHLPSHLEHFLFCCGCCRWHWVHHYGKRRRGSQTIGFEFWKRNHEGCRTETASTPSENRRMKSSVV